MLITEVQRGLAMRPRSLAPWMFYDARGSQIFERITQLPEYYPTRTERNILARNGERILAAAFPDRAKALRLVELGAGTGAKTAILLNAAARSREDVLYVPVDVSLAALEMARETITTLSPEVDIAPIVANYVTDPPRLESFPGPTLGLYIGSSIGNFAPAEARTILCNLIGQLQAGDALLLGVDMVKDERTLVAAYDDRQGVTAAFNVNLLHRLNRELNADFNPLKFRHRAFWNPLHSRIEMHLESTCDQQVRIPGADLHVHFARGEGIHTENSYKFTSEMIGMLLGDAGFSVEHTWTDERRWYSVTLARVR
ncbi:MAG TPA: L-histidine N(alpha)-methyltransferase [Gemmataceae bacterium]|nr:L-histidine N(alpha)-methyltransferase [Pirellulales bacterium]HZZ80747.1 L-histidine N(alpha)-methyltransferase [Gemmataceae bacterium]